MIRPDVLFFDAGNTLVHLDHAFIRDVCAGRGVATTDADILVAEYVARQQVNALFRSGQKTTDEDRWYMYFRIVLSEIGVAADDIAGYVEPLTSRHRELNLWSRLLEGTADVLDLLARHGYRLAMISNSDGRIASLMETVGIASRLETIVDSGTEGIEKPDPEIFMIGCRRMGITPDQALYIGDIYEIDIVGARRAGMPAVLIDPLDRLDDADCPRIRSILDLPGFLERLELPTE